MAVPTISRLLPIIKNYVKIPGGEIHLSTRLTAKEVVDLIPGSRIVRVGPSGSKMAVSLESVGLAHSFDLKRYDFFVELPEYVSQSGPAQDWFAVLLAAASA